MTADDFFYRDYNRLRRSNQLWQNQWSETRQQLDQVQRLLQRAQTKKRHYKQSAAALRRGMQGRARAIQTAHRMVSQLQSDFRELQDVRVEMRTITIKNNHAADQIPDRTQDIAHGIQQARINFNRHHRDTKIRFIRWTSNDWVHVQDNRLNRGDETWGKSITIWVTFGHSYSARLNNKHSNEDWKGYSYGFIRELDNFGGGWQLNDNL